MGFNKSRYAFDDLRDLFQQALDDEQGIEIACKNHGEAMSIRSRLHYLRTKDAEDNARTYPDDHPLHNASVWDKLVLRVPAKGRDNDHVITITRRLLPHLIIKRLTDSG